MNGSPVKLEILYPFVGGGLCLDKSVAVPKHGRDAWLGQHAFGQHCSDAALIISTDLQQGSCQYGP